MIGAVLGTALGLLAVTSCQDITDLQPADAFSETTAFSTPQRVELSVIGMYNAAQSGTYAGNVVRGYPFGAANVQQSEMRGEDMLNQALFYAITNESTYTPFSANNVWMWNTLFTLVNQCNVTIEGVQKAATDGIITQDVALGYEGEARFLRALAYHELLTHFARPYSDNNGANPGMPIRDFAVVSPATVDKAIATGRSTVAENYAFILADLDFAETNLPATRTGNLRVFRSVKGAAIALKTRVKLHKQDWAGVITEGNKIVSASAPFTSPISGFALLPTAAGPFQNQASAEAVFSIENNEQDNPGVNGALASMMGNLALGGRGLIRVSPISYNLKEWPADDARRALLVKDARSYYTAKFFDYTNRSDNNPIIRYAEVILNLSEAEARASAAPVSPRALALLNAIRGRGLASAVFAAGDFATKVDFVKAILVERRIELLAEGRRWADIHRLAPEAAYGTGGIPAKMAYGNATFATYNFVTPPTLTKTIAAIPYSDHRFLWPFPADEVSRNPTLATQQNPGY
ncbi:hypothetical protein GCM10007390_19980 [Persicitalea jodogahamensis]|uniref:RagB/SusD family nutrient uptake outer membrane protein n=2 Tax=Persicitalea jodogahamensis TaxID=402147 RepID=A0A8J3G9T4_9BACT|nr:hypothetical protein GCM10007390_19980 [Persicitalea jodogahamensis]